jgi:hypothetical protein
VSFADDIWQQAKAHQECYAAGVRASDGESARKLAALVEAAHVAATLLAINPPSEYLNNRVASELAAGVQKARQ